MPSSLQARMIRNAISPRLAIRTFSNMMVERDRWAASFARGSQLPDTEKNLTELHRLAILSDHFSDDTARFGFDFVHHFHRLNNANHCVFSDGFSDIYERRSIRRSVAVERPDHG